MIKYLILFIHLIGLSFYQLIFGDVSVSQNLPTNFNAGEEVVVEVVVKKEGVGGFAKVQQTLPDGFIAEVIDAKGATFSFKDNIVKFIWMALPSENEFKVSYKLKTIESVEGNFTLAGKFSFIDENERKNIEIPSSAITITKKSEPIAAVVEETSAPEETEIESEEVPAVAELETPNTETEVVPTVVEDIAAENKSVTISCERTIIEIDNGNAFKVSMKIAHTNLEGFAKIVETIPTGFTAEIIDSKGGVFSFKDNEAKILWMAAPVTKEFEVAYKLIAVDATPNSYTVNGAFSYLDNDVTQKYIINSSDFTLSKTSEEPIASSIEESIEEEVFEEVAEEPTIKEEEVIEVVDETPVAEVVNTKKVTSTPNPETGVSYKVQVGAGHQKVSKNYFVNKFNLTDPVATENHEGWIKYIVGSYSEYKAARDKRNNVRNNVKTAFVTAYNQGSRITVQEALMISNQKWYK
jgi:hypothetical protein